MVLLSPFLQEPVYLPVQDNPLCLYLGLLCNLVLVHKQLLLIINRLGPDNKEYSNIIFNIHASARHSSYLDEDQPLPSLRATHFLEHIPRFLELLHLDLRVDL